MNIGIIGTGSIARKFAVAVNKVEGVVLYAVSSRTLSNARKFAEEYNAKEWFEGTDDFYKREAIDLVYIATPNSSHCSNTVLALNNNRAVLCEKPFAMNLIEAKKMVKLAQDKKLLLVEAMWTKYFPGIKKVKELLDDKSLGEIITIQGDLSYPLGRSKERLYKKEMGGGALLDLGIYPISIAHYFLGYPDSIKASSHFSDTGVDESTSVILSYNSGKTAILSSSIIATSTNEFIINCTNGWVRINGNFHHPTSISLFINGKGEVHKEYPREGYGYEYQIEGIYKDFQSGQTESSTVKLKDTLEVMDILDKIRKIVGYQFND